MPGPDFGPDLGPDQYPWITYTFNPLITSQTNGYLPDNILSNTNNKLDNILTELSISDNGDLLVGPNGDFQLSYGPKALAEHIMVRLRTYLNEASSMLGVGSIIQDFAGRPNTREVGYELEQAAKNALTRDGFLSLEDISITAVPENIETGHIVLFVDPDVNNTGLFKGVLSFNIDLSTGSIN